MTHLRGVHATHRSSAATRHTAEPDALTHHLRPALLLNALLTADRSDAPPLLETHYGLAGPDPYLDDGSDPFVWPQLPPQGLGIGVITFNRLPLLKRCLMAIRRYTQIPFHVVVADDGSADGTAAWCHAVGLPVVTGPNGGCAINKNRALGYLLAYTDCDPILLLEDDAIPNMEGWETDWISCCLRYGHVNYATPYHLDGHVLSGTGTPAEPWFCASLSGQCTITTRSELMRVGYLDSRFAGYGEEHVEWTMRFSKDWPFLERPFTTPLLNAGLTLAQSGSFFNRTQRDRNRDLLQRIMTESIYRDPYRADGTGCVKPACFWLELRQAVSCHPIAEPEVTPYRTDCFLAAAACPQTTAFEDVIVTLATNQFKETYLRGLLNSLRANGGTGFTLVVLHEEDGTDWDSYLAAYGAVGIPFRRLRSIPGAANDWFVKGLLYSVAEFVPARRYVCLDCDTLVLDSLADLWSALDVMCQDRLLFAFDGNGVGLQGTNLRNLHLRDYVTKLYDGVPGDLDRLRPDISGSGYSLLLNSGVFAGHRQGLLNLSRKLRNMMPGAWGWMAAAPESPREQCLVNLAVADGAGLEMDGTFNVQMHEPSTVADLEITPAYRARWQGRAVRILHFSGPDKSRYCPELQAYYQGLTSFPGGWAVGKPPQARSRV